MDHKQNIYTLLQMDKYTSILSLKFLKALPKQQHQSTEGITVTNKRLEIISTLPRQIGIPLPTVPPGVSLCIKTGNQIGG